MTSPSNWLALCDFCKGYESRCPGCQQEINRLSSDLEEAKQVAARLVIRAEAAERERDHQLQVQREMAAALKSFADIDFGTPPAHRQLVPICVDDVGRAQKALAKVKQ